MQSFLKYFYFDHNFSQEPSFSKPFSLVIYNLAILSLDTHKGHIHGHKGSGHYGYFGHNGHNGLPLYGHEYGLYRCQMKEWPKCRSPVKTVLKKMDPVKSYGQNKKISKKIEFLVHFLCKISPILK